MPPPNYRPHRRRAVGENRPPLTIQDRDRDLLVAVGRHRFLTMELAALLFPARTTASLQRGKIYVPPPPPSGANARKPENPPTRGRHLYSRLAKLYHHGFLDRLRTVTGGPLVYALTREGYKFLAAHYHQLSLPFPVTEQPETLARNATVSTLYINHALLAARVAISLEAACRASDKLYELRHYERGTDRTKAEWNSRGRTIRIAPDAFAVICYLPTGKQLACLIEADRGTMTHKRMAAKFRRYSRLYEERMHQEFYGVPTFQVLTVTTSAGRRDNLAEAVAANETIPSNSRRLFMFADATDFADHPENILAAIWRPARDPAAVVALGPDPLKRK